VAVFDGGRVSLIGRFSFLGRVSIDGAGGAPFAESVALGGIA
jgi:hypothetical protein